MTPTEQKLLKRDWTVAFIYLPGVQPISITPEEDYSISDEVLTIKHEDGIMPKRTPEEADAPAYSEMHINLMTVSRVAFFRQKHIATPPKSMIIAP